MKKIVLASTLLGTLLVAAGVNAAVDNETVKQRTEQLKTEFNLNEQQVSRIQNIIVKGAMSDDERRAERQQQHMEKRLDRMKEKLGLSDEQVTQLKTLMTEQEQKMKAVRDEGKTRMESILTPEQLTKMQEMRPEGKHRGRGHGGHGRHGGMHD